MIRYTRWLALACATGLMTPTFAAAAASAAPVTLADDGPRYGAELQGFDYPYPVQRFAFTSQGQALQMAYLDVAPPAARANGQTVVLLHGKNFCSATWQGSIDALSAAGYRVIAIDQIGFCKSSKPAAYQFTFQQLARNTHALLARLGIRQPIVMGHSTGGMLGIRYALMYPEGVSRLVLVDPIGLEDWKAEGVPSISVDQWYRRELGTTAERIRDYERRTYYGGTWRADYEPWVQMLAGMYRGPGKQQVAWNSALLYDMIYTQPVVYELERLTPPTLLVIGAKDTTAIGKDLAPPEIQKRLGNYPALGQRAAQRIPHATLLMFPDAGHSPQVQEPAAFHRALLQYLADSAPAPAHP